MKNAIALFAFVLLAACATAQAPAGSGRMDWRCDSGRAFSVRINGSGEAEVFAGGQNFRLQHVAGASGARYSNGGVEYWERAGSATLTGAPGSPYNNCHR